MSPDADPSAGSAGSLDAEMASPTPSSGGPAPDAQVDTCYVHKDRRAGVRCQRCERLICPHCMHTASVGFHCPKCARSGRQKVLTAATLHQGERPYATQALLAINVAVFLVGVVIDPGAFLGLGQLGEDGALFGPLVAEGEWWRIVTSGFLHIGPVHLLFNMFALYNLGPTLEREVGRLRFVLLYLTSLLTGSLAVLLIDPNAATAGASGAIFGLLGVLLIAQRARGINPWRSGVGGILLLNLLITFGIPGISIGAHIGGLAGGVLSGWLLFELAPRLADKRLVTAAQAALAAAAVIGCIAVA